MWIIRGEQESTQEAGGARGWGLPVPVGRGWGWLLPNLSKEVGFFFPLAWGGKGELSHFGHETQTSPRQGTRKFFKAPIKGLGEVRGF